MTASATQMRMNKVDPFKTRFKQNAVLHGSASRTTTVEEHKLLHCACINYSACRMQRRVRCEEQDSYESALPLLEELHWLPPMSFLDTCRTPFGVTNPL